jgi:predicted nucleic acid-binding protein
VVKRLVFVDTGVLIAAARGSDEAAQRAMQILDDPDSSFASSIFVQLEVLPKPVYHKKRDEVAFYETFFEAVSAWADPGSQLIQNAYDEAARIGLSAMDALHVAAAAAIGADELVTTEKLTNPIHRATLVPVRTIVPAGR